MLSEITGRFAPWFGLLTVCVAVLGCGGSDNVARVTGVVTLNDEPLANATVRFQPIAGGRPSTAITDSAGRYDLVYTRSEQGAEVGRHTVSITTYDAGDPDGEPPRPTTPEKVPARYNAPSELTADVAAGSNAIDFKLDGSSPIVQPREPVE